MPPLLLGAVCCNVSVSAAFRHPSLAPRIPEESVRYVWYLVSSIKRRSSTHVPVSRRCDQFSSVPDSYAWRPSYSMRASPAPLPITLRPVAQRHGLLSHSPNPQTNRRRRILDFRNSRSMLNIYQDPLSSSQTRRYVGFRCHAELVLSVERDRKQGNSIKVAAVTAWCRHMAVSPCSNYYTQYDICPALDGLVGRSRW
ncbi:hypothetical protein V8C43DRAFT_273556 [Trichoderma afarasin]